MRFLALFVPLCVVSPLLGSCIDTKADNEVSQNRVGLSAVCGVTSPDGGVTSPTATPCTTHADCSSGEVCTRAWNQDVARSLAAAGAASQVGHCLDPSDGGIDDVAVQADIDVLEAFAANAPTGYVANFRGFRYSLPDRAEIGVSSTLVISGRILLDGRGAVLRVKPGQTGLRLQGALASLIEVKDLTVAACPQPEPGDIGVDVKAARTRLDNVHVVNMPRGIRYIDAEPELYNVQNWQDVYVKGASERAVEVDGSDTGAGWISGLTIENSNLGLRASSFLGNAYVGTYVGNTTTALRVRCNPEDMATCAGVEACSTCPFKGCFVDNKEGDACLTEWAHAINAPSTYVGFNFSGSPAIDWGPGESGRLMLTVGGQLASRSSDTNGDSIGALRSRVWFQEGSGTDEDLFLIRVPGDSVNGAGAMSWRYRPGFETCTTSWDFWNLQPVPGLNYGGGVPTAADFRRAWTFRHDDNTASEPSLTLVSDVSALPTSCPGVVSYSLNRIEYGGQTICDDGVTTCGF